MNTASRIVRWSLAVACVAAALSNPRARAAEADPTPADMQRRDHWIDAHLTGTAPAWPFAFTFDGRPSAVLLGAWPAEEKVKPLDAHRTQHTRIWTDPATGLEVRGVGVVYADYPAIEWTIYLKNTGTARAPILENIQGLDTRFMRGEAGEFLLHRWNGDTGAPDLYQPFAEPLGPGVRKRFAPSGGRGSNGAFPYYNLESDGGGVMIAVGWPGQWATTFTRDAGRTLRVVAGQEITHLALEPGEMVRTPLIALVFWQGGDAVRAQNLWRRWMWDHNVPRTADGRLPEPRLFGNTSLEFNEMTGATEENQNHFLDRYAAERIPIDFWWMDAGWYPCDGQWPRTGTWEPDPTRFPRGLRAISDHARTRGIKTLVWFEPERVAGDTWLAVNHPEWLLGGTLLNLGNPAARAWLTDHVDSVLREQGIDLYRQDFNMDPLDFWRRNDAPDRRGITENFHIRGYLDYWDALRARHPGLVIDSCASGGRRNDLETMRRAIALHPTDYNYADLPTKQAFHHALFPWLPAFGSNTMPVDTVDPYAFRSGHAPHVVLGYDLRRTDLDTEALRRLAAEWRTVAASYRGDYYPLTPYSRTPDAWLAWQFHRPGADAGVVEAFRRDGCDAGSQTFRLRGLDTAASYTVRDLGTGAERTIPGRELMEEGLEVTIDARPGAAALAYERTGR